MDVCRHQPLLVAIVSCMAGQDKAGNPKVARLRSISLSCYRNAGGGNRIPGENNVGVNRDSPAGSLP